MEQNHKLTIKMNKININNTNYETCISKKRKKENNNNN
jgi:hypothetical protein